jgi:hypothetical protein
MILSVRILIVLLCPLLLGGCVNRTQADSRLAKACAAGVNALLPDGQTLGDIEDKKFTDSPEGINYRHVTIKVKQMDGWLEGDGTYECVFEEQFGFFASSHTASIYQLKIGDRTYGKAGNEILGSTEDMLKLTDAIRKSLYE